MTDPSPAPAPVTPLEYPYATYRGRPGIITAIGVMSIVVACLSGLANLYGAFSSITFLVMSRTMMPAMVVAAPPTTAGTAPAPASAPTATTVTAGPVAPATLPTSAGAAAGGSFSVTVVQGSGGTTTVTPTAPAAGGPGAVMANPFSGLNPIATGFSAATNVLGLGLAIFLLVAGIQTLRDAPSGAKLHCWYVWLKIPLVFLATAATVWMWSGFMRAMMASMPAPAPGTPPTPLPRSWIMHISTFMGAALALAYPVALIFVLRSRTVRGYYNAVRE